jgi:hypothetical protein
MRGLAALAVAVAIGWAFVVVYGCGTCHQFKVQLIPAQTLEACQTLREQFERAVDKGGFSVHLMAVSQTCVPVETSPDGEGGP